MYWENPIHKNIVNPIPIPNTIAQAWSAIGFVTRKCFCQNNRTSPTVSALQSMNSPSLTKLMPLCPDCWPILRLRTFSRCSPSAMPLTTTLCARRPYPVGSSRDRLRRACWRFLTPPCRRSSKCAKPSSARIASPRWDPSRRRGRTSRRRWRRSRPGD